MELVRLGSPAALPAEFERAAWDLPVVVVRAGADAQRAFIEFFVAHHRNRNTRAAYARAVARFLAWVGERHLELRQVTPVQVAAYIETHPGSAPSVKQHLAAIRALFDYLVRRGVLPHNPAAPVRGPKHVVTKGKTPVLEAVDARKLLDSIDVGTLKGLRDRAVIGTMLYTFARVGAVTGLRVRDYHHVGRRSWIRLLEKGGKHHEVPAHHALQAYLDAYLERAELEDAGSPLFQSLARDRRGLSGRAMTSRDVQRMLARRARVAGVAGALSPHSFRATGITIYLQNGGTLEHAQRIAAHASPRTTKLYDRTGDGVMLGEIERIRL